jgi:hypothetical protein
VNYLQLNGDDSSSDSSSEDTVNISSKSSSSSSSSPTDDDNLLYKNQTFVTCRSPSDLFYLCQVLHDVYTNTKRIRIRWCSVIGEDGDDTKISINTRFKLSYVDALDPNTILTSITDVIDHGDNTISLKKGDIVETKRLLEKSIRGEALSSDDMMDLSTEHQKLSAKTSKKMLKHIHFESSPNSDSSSDSPSPTTFSRQSNKRKIVTPDKKPSRKQPAKKRARKTSDNAVRKFPSVKNSLNSLL